MLLILIPLPALLWENAGCSKVFPNCLFLSLCWTWRHSLTSCPELWEINKSPDMTLLSPFITSSITIVGWLILESESMLAHFRGIIWRLVIFLAFHCKLVYNYFNKNWTLLNEGGVFPPICENEAAHTESSNPFLRDLIITCPQVAWNRGNHWFGVKKGKG